MKQPRSSSNGVSLICSKISSASVIVLLALWSSASRVHATGFISQLESRDSVTDHHTLVLASVLGHGTTTNTSGETDPLQRFRYDHIPSNERGQYGQSTELFFSQYFSSNFFVSSKSSPVCANHTRIFLEEIAQFQPWALQMLDASAKIPSGILQGNSEWWGSFSECLHTEFNLNSTKYPNILPSFSGQYCSVTLSLDHNTAANNATTRKLQEFLSQFNLVIPGMDKLALTVGLCIPSTCSSNDIEANVQKILDLLNVGAKAETQSCYSKNSQQLDSATLAVFSVWGVFGLLIVLGTLYEISTILKQRCWCIREMAFKTLFTESPSMDPLSYSVSEQNLSRNSQFGNLLLSFSTIANGKQILNVNESRGNLSVLHGMRFLSMAWIILGHTYFFGLLASPIWDNLKDFAFITKEFAFQGILRGILAVDTFLFLSGLLVVFVSLKKMRASNGKLNIPMFYVHRLIRLSPVYMMTIAWMSGPSDYVTVGGPLWSAVTKYKTDCHKTWWKSLLYINNFGDTTQMCAPHSWYISLDTQLYLITPILLYPLYRYPRLGVTLTVLCIAASCTAAGVISYVMGLPSSALLSTVSIDKVVAYSIDYYIKPYCRMGPYGVGMLIGYLLLKEDCKNKLKPPVAYLLWCLAIVCNLSVLYGTYGQFLSLQEPSILQSAIYNALSGTMWALGIGWLIYACVTGYGGFINTILSWKAWIPLSRLTYCAYLLHMIVLHTFFYSREDKLHFDHIIMVVFYLGLLVITYGFSFLFSLIFEAPFIQLEKALRESRSRDINLNEVSPR